MSPPPSITPETFRDVIGRFATGVTVITTAVEDQPFGTTASAVSSLSLEPPMLLICMNRQSVTGEAIARSGTFAVNILDETQPELARRFATKDPEKFRGVPVTVSARGLPLLDGSLAQVECRVTEQVTGGSHIVFIGEVQHAAGRAGSPLAYFRGQFGRLQLEADPPELRARLAAELAAAVLSAGTMGPSQLAELKDAHRSVVEAYAAGDVAAAGEALQRSFRAVLGG